MSYPRMLVIECFSTRPYPPREKQLPDRCVFEPYFLCVSATNKMCKNPTILRVKLEWWHTIGNLTQLRALWVIYTWLYCHRYTSQGDNNGAQKQSFLDTNLPRGAGRFIQVLSDKTHNICNNRGCREQLEYFIIHHHLSLSLSYLDAGPTHYKVTHG